MKIFFLTQFYFDLHKPILAELERQGHEVYMEEDVSLPIDPNYKKENLFLRSIKKIYRRITNLEVLYWKNKIRENSAYNAKYDLLLCINGTSFNPYLLKHFRKSNPEIKSVLYLWDTNNYYDFFRYNKYFDRVLTFDLDDAESENKVEVLHSYWYPSEPRELKFKLYSVGSDHDDRIEILGKIYQQLQTAQLPSFIRVVIKRPTPFSFINRILRFDMHKHKKMEAYEQKKKLPFTSEESIPVNKILDYIDESECVLDTDMSIQTGATERVIWALARGKKIISTNYNLKRLPFYNSEQIKFIDRKNPVVDLEFLKDYKVFPIVKSVQDLRIDRWVHHLIDFD